MQHTRDSDGNYMWLPKRKMWAQLTEQDKNCIYSNYAFGVKSAQIDTRYCNIPCGCLLRYKDTTYMVTSCITDRLYAQIQAARVVLTQCTLHRYVPVKDELNRQKQVKERLFSFPAVLGEKYVRPTDSITHHEVTQGIMATTHKDIALHEGDIITAGDKSYAVRACHTTDPDKNDYEIERISDV